jgi:hypothetical protein
MIRIKLQFSSIDHKARQLWLLAAHPNSALLSFLLCHLQHASDAGSPPSLNLSPVHTLYAPAWGCLPLLLSGQIHALLRD